MNYLNLSIIVLRVLISAKTIAYVAVSIASNLLCLIESFLHFISLTQRTAFIPEDFESDHRNLLVLYLHTIYWYWS